MVASASLNRMNTPRRTAANGARFSKKASKPNASILSFFQKVHKEEESLFVGSRQDPQPCNDDIYGNDDRRFNESELPSKKPRLAEEPTVKEQLTVETVQKTRAPTRMPFILDSDSEGEDDAHGLEAPRTTVPKTEDLDFETRNEQLSLERQSSAEAQLENVQDLDRLDLDGFEGEELRERRFMLEQARLEAEEADDDVDDALDDAATEIATEESCPICNGSLAGVSADDATRHVNSCLDGNPIPLPVADLAPDEVDSAQVGKRFARAAIPRPAQANPFELDGGGAVEAKNSAFSKLMSNKAEDSAWTTAAAAEHASRGRPAYERTCPFYKIMPGFNICVDAFRYGAVQGCEAYFLSHFHSDHYMGLTANWRHGPIYCSKVTGSLVKKQLRTASKWVVELEFDKPFDVSGTGVTVTMIPANHCPGSSLFLFEKPLGGGRMRRILHCGDFRACPGHITHPLLRPDVINSVSGKKRQQTIHMCYLDTTYLNPRYSFPPQDDVIKACAELCASISPDPESHDDVWEQSAGSGEAQTMGKYFTSNKPGKKTVGGAKLGQRLLVICGTYSIGKERICIAIAKALKTKIFAAPAKMKICKQLDDAELSGLLTSNPVEAQVHMQSLMEIRAETLKDYLASYRPHFSRIVGFRPSGWTFRPGNGKSFGANTPPSSVPTQQILHGKGWRTRFGCKDLVIQRGSTKEAMCFGVPYSEHSSFRELAMFVMGLRIEKVIPTVNVGSEQSRKRMKGWIDRWMAERRRGGLVVPMVEEETDEKEELELWDGKTAQGGGVWW
ncbi:hypothetical protein L249_6378 [Ophiocordyceps polyrhachis-furcata BCC 54312]|uniref:DNA repair metallo-beta-lactamase domain-containing protein n=1 Tax=Ophiocordyceps polyrhachis-furcata BCC 54312 TaxID=1330021 RepID=A0A367LJK3_9HYPO|nr:hypothetical protein L249_6378 [Ophiocordyceps polyrhachis-furcata BCC 54312]